MASPKTPLHPQVLEELKGWIEEKQPIVTPHAPLMVTGVFPDSAKRKYSKVTINAGEEFILSDVRAGKRHTAVLSLTPAIDRDYEAIEMESGLVSSWPELFEAYKVAVLGVVNQAAIREGLDGKTTDDIASSMPDKPDDWLGIISSWREAEEKRAEDERKKAEEAKKEKALGANPEWGDWA